MNVMIAIIGHISAGKTTAAKTLARLLNAAYIGYDDVHRQLLAQRHISRDQIPEQIDLLDQLTYEEMHQRITLLLPASPIVIEATGASNLFSNILEHYRQSTTLILLHCTSDTWHTREISRTDRFPLESHIRELTAQPAALTPDVMIDTTTKLPTDIVMSILQTLRERLP